jgi:antitoxin VapB
MGALNIKDADVAKKARKLAKLMGTSITATVSAALDESLSSAERKTEVANAARRKKIDALLKRFRTIVPQDSAAWETFDAMYDENGLPK